MNSILKRILVPTGALALGIVAGVEINEGYNPNAYKDSAGIWTICYGDTYNVKAGMTLSADQCRARLNRSLEKHSKALEDLPEDTPDVVLLGAMDLAFNIGVYGFDTSSVKRSLHKKNYEEAGNNVLRWKYITINKDGKQEKYDCSKAGNKVCAGLWRRRLWQADAIGNRFQNVDEAIGALKAIYQYNAD